MPPTVDPVAPRQTLGLFTDLYELTMARAYHEEGMEGTAVFELFFRELPEHRGFILAAGLGPLLERLESFRFGDDDLAWLRARDDMPDDFVDRLADFRFTGSVWAVREGTPVFPDEPIVQVVAPILEAQLLETLILNQIHAQSVLASKAARIALAAGDRAVIDFGSRRAHGFDAALAAARCSWLGGLGGTSNVLAGAEFGVPVFGTMAHSYVQAHDREDDAFEAFARTFPGTTLLVDTYDTLAGVDTVIDLATRERDPIEVGAIRLDSGDLEALARASRERLDAAGLDAVDIFASGGLDEFRISELVEAGAPIDGFGVGTRLVVSRDAPSLDMAYKLVEYDGRPRMKRSTGKGMHPGRKQVFRVFEDGRAVRDVLGGWEETGLGRPLLEPAWVDGRRTGPGEASLDDAREHARASVAALPDGLRAIRAPAATWPVEVSDLLRAREERVEEDLPGTPADEGR